MTASAQLPAAGDRPVATRPVAIVTGGGVGIGRAIAVGLAAAGFDVAVTYRSHDPEGLEAELAGLGAACLALRLDATDADAVAASVSAVASRFGRVDALVNNVGGLVGRVPVTEMTVEHWHEVLDLNLTSAFLVTRQVAPLLPSGGRIVNIASLAGENGGGPGASAYAAAKAGLIGWTRALAKELGPRGITVNAVAPGYIDQTPFHATFSTDEARVAMVAGTPVGRAGEPGDVADAVAYLVSAGAGFVTGAVLDLNGGAYFS